MDNKKTLVINFARCEKCGTCVNICPEEAIAIIRSSLCAKCIKYCISMKVPCTPEQIFINHSKCNACGICIEKCRFGAIYFYEIDSIKKPINNLKT